MQFEVITINYPEGEYNATPDARLIFNDTKALEDFLNDKHSECTSAVVTVLPEKNDAHLGRAKVIEEMAVHFEESVRQVWDKDEIAQRLRDFADTARSGQDAAVFEVVLHMFEENRWKSCIRPPLQKLSPAIPQEERVDRAVVIEECARVCEARIHGDDAGSSHYAPYDAEAAGCAKAIRALIGS
jgi:hypothetical protein